MSCRARKAYRSPRPPARWRSRRCWPPTPRRSRRRCRPEAAMATVLVIGASHGIGLETVKRALDAGHRVRAFARSAASIPLSAPALEKFGGDALDKTRVAAAVAGTDAVIQSLGAAKGPQAILSGTNPFSRATRILIDAMRENGVRRLVTVTGLGAGDSRGHGSFVYD